jgi:hypothetical protein
MARWTNQIAAQASPISQPSVATPTKNAQAPKSHLGRNCFNDFFLKSDPAISGELENQVTGAHSQFNEAIGLT